MGMLGAALAQNNEEFSRKRKPTSRRCISRNLEVKFFIHFVASLSKDLRKGWAEVDTLYLITARHIGRV